MGFPHTAYKVYRKLRAGAAGSLDDFGFLASDRETEAARADRRADEKRMIGGVMSKKGTSDANTNHNRCFFMAGYLYQSWQGIARLE